MQVWLNGQFIEVNVLDAQGGYGGYAYPVQGVGRQEMVQVAMDVVQRAQQFGHERDVHVLIGRNAATAFLQPGVAIQPVHAGELQNLWTLAAQGQFEKTAARALYLLLAARHRQKSLDVRSAADAGRYGGDVVDRDAWRLSLTLRATILLLTWGLTVAGCADGASDSPTLNDAAGATAPDGKGSAGSCGNITFQGNCDGTTITWCDSGQIQTVNCKAAGHSGCKLVGGIYDCYDDKSGPYQTCKATCETQCSKMICQATSPSGMKQCGLDRDNCKASCPCSCYAAAPTGVAADQSACSAACQHQCSVDSGKCLAACSGGGGGCGSKCTSANAACLSASAKTCFK